jgi:outer membrane PBP1 activator LpoA protein
MSAAKTDHLARSNPYGSARSILTAAVLLAIVAVVAGCASAPSQPQSTPDTVPETTSDLSALLAQAGAATPARGSQLYLDAAWQYFELGDLEAAQSTAALVDNSFLSGADITRRQLLAAEFAIARGDSAEADRLLADLVLTADTQPSTAARVCAIAGDFICAANRLIDSAAGDPAKNNLIWRYLGLAPGLSVASQSEQLAGDKRGWWQLKLAVLQSRSIAERQQAVAFWRRSWPEHPAARLVPDDLQAALSAPSSVRHLGLLLPLSGPLAGAGEAVRDGVVAGYLREQTDSQVRVSFYDTQSAPLPILYEQALSDGVDFLIGPLRKELVAQFSELNPQLPVLALNYLDQSAPAAQTLTQLGLAIEDEATSITRTLEATGINSLLVFHNYEDWSLRARRQLSENWSGRLTVQPFTDIRTITEAVGNAMDVEASQNRHDELNKILREELEFLPRARQDIQAIVALVDNVEANALVPALQFHFADQLPVYASSQVVRGARRTQLTELSGFKVSELPWYLNNDRLFLEMQQPFALTGNRFSALYALGADALRIAMLLNTLQRDNTTVMLGSTGALALHSDGRFHRELSWAVIRNGQITPAEPARVQAGD